VPTSRVDLSDAEIVDNHCHGMVVDEMLKSDPATFESRLTLTGQAYLTSNQNDPAVWRSIEALVEGNAYSLISRRWLCEFLRCAEDATSLTQARDRVLRADPVGYTRRLLADQKIVELVADEGYTYMPVGGATSSGWSQSRCTGWPALSRSSTISSARTWQTSTGSPTPCSSNSTRPPGTPAPSP
jgi:hypothetical protein